MNFHLIPLKPTLFVFSQIYIARTSVHFQFPLFLMSYHMAISYDLDLLKIIEISYINRKLLAVDHVSQIITILINLKILIEYNTLFAWA